MKTYSELIELPTYYERLMYLRTRGKAGVSNAEVDRYFAENFYRSPEWKRVRREILLRDNFCDLAIPGLSVPIGAIVHHINALTMDDVLKGNHNKLFAHNNLITTSLQTHNQIHYGGEVIIPDERFRDDHIEWERKYTHVQKK